MTLYSVSATLEGLGPQFIAVAIIGARLVPVAFLCPLLGGAQAPSTVKLTLVLVLSVFLYRAAGLEAAVSSPVEALGVVVHEAVVGTTLGLVASLPFDAARVGGRFMDLFRGTSAEASLPLAGSREAASGDLLYQLLLALAASSVAMPLVLHALMSSYRWAPPGTFAHTPEVALSAALLVGSAFATGLAIGAPVAGVAMATDALVGLASRAAPSMNLSEVGTPVRILAGGAVMWLGIGVIAARLEVELLELPAHLASLLAGGTP